LTIVNAYTQYDFRGRAVRADYEAIRSCLRWIGRRFPESKIGLPRIGAGLAGGDWAIISGIIEEELGEHDVTIVEYKP
jgi:hypothetical protein